ncbi:MAG TPA: MFS transporter [Chloroflexota bacterium]|nr:MFS transporter [Chloroflexota bacterium]
MRQLLARRDVRIYLVGQGLSLFGDTALFLVLGIWVKTLTGSNGAAGLVFFFLALPSLAAPLAGLAVDRMRRRPLMIGMDMVIGAAVLLLLLVHGRDRIWLIYAVALVYGASGSVFSSAQSALLTVMLPGELLGEVNAFLQTWREGLRLLAPLLGAALFAAFGGGFVAVIDAASFGVSALCLAILQVSEPEPHPSEHHFRHEVSAGVRHIFQTQALREIVLAVGVALLVVGFAETVIFAVISQGLHRPPAFLGVLSSAQGVGAIAGGLTAARVLRRVGDGRLLGLGLGLFGIGSLLLMVSSLPVVVVAGMIAGSGLPWALVAFGTAIQRRSPPHLQGRVYSAADTMVTVPQTISIALGAGLSTVVDYHILLGVMGLVLLGTAAYLVPRRFPEPAGHQGENGQIPKRAESRRTEVAGGADVA